MTTPISPEAQDWIQKKNILEAHYLLTSSWIVRESSGSIPRPLSDVQACALIGQMMHEADSQDLTNLDIKEYGRPHMGRGALQFTNERRKGYDYHLADAKAKGYDPNSLVWQLQHLAQEYAGFYDEVGGGDLAYHTGIFHDPRYTSQQDPYQATLDMTDNYLRPARDASHYDRRYNNTMKCLGIVEQQKQQLQQEQNVNSLI